jgi:hypothetical protein
MILTGTPKKSEIANQRAKQGSKKYSGKILEKKTIEKYSVLLIDQKRSLKIFCVQNLVMMIIIK